MKLALNMIVKNEAARIERALASVVQFIDYWVITDTGSTDDTVAVIKKFFARHSIPGQITRAPFKDWSQARNAALIAARSTAKRHGCDYIMLMDADMELVVKDRAQFLGARNGLSYDMQQRGGTLHYMNRRLVRVDAKGLYLGVTHEYLDVATAGSIPETVAHFIDHADGANRPEKYKRDISLLLAGLKKEPNNGRYFFYLAQSYRDAGDLPNAMTWYKKRVEAGGWPEEQWNAQVNFAHCLRDMGNEAAFVREMLVAYNMRPSRAESLYDLAHYFRMQEHSQPIAALFAEVALSIPQSTDGLFVNNFVYDAGVKEEFSITAFYVPPQRARGFEVTDQLTLQRTPYTQARECARQNLYHYLPTLKDACPSFTWKRIPFEPPENWTAMNPSVTLHSGALHAVIRTVNYRIDEHGRYLIQGTDGTANATNPINTRNYLMSLDPDFNAGSHVELLPSGNLPCEFPPVIGFEDMRIFSHEDELWTSSTVRQIHPDGNCEQVLARLDGDKIVDVKRMLRQPRSTEKNWAPIVDGLDLKFMWRIGEVVDADGTTIICHDTGLDTGHISGGSQLIPFAMGWLSVVHEARQLPNSPCRYYFHRFVQYDAEFKLVKLSRPFVFNEKGIEFAAGLCWHPTDPSLLVISYGFKDAEARIGTVTEDDVVRLLWAPMC
jgi:glycosyltransferase involved in cell wall biosynthesis